MKKMQIEAVTHIVVVHVDSEKLEGVVQMLAKLKNMVVVDCMTTLVGQLDYVDMYVT
jgi:hypothetical protein